MEEQRPPTPYQLSVERPAMLIALALDIVLAVALAVTVVLKAYMLVLTDLVCSPDLTSLGNQIRCLTMLEIAAGFLATSGVLAAACGLLTTQPQVWSRVLGLFATAALAAVIDAVIQGDHSWQLTLAVVALFGISTLTLATGHLLNLLARRSIDVIRDGQT